MAMIQTHHRAKPRTIASEHKVDIHVATPPCDAVRRPALEEVVADAAAASPVLVAALEEAAALETDEAGAVEVNFAAAAVPVAVPVAAPEPTPLCGEEAAVKDEPTSDAELAAVADDAMGVEAAVETEAAMELEDGGELMLMFLIVNFPEALPLSPKRTRI
jgi:hypothetical protein